MKQTIKTLAIALGATVVMAGCRSEKKDTHTIIATKPAPKEPKAPVKMQEYTQETDFTLVGSKLHCTIHRTPSDSLAKVKDEGGQQYIDNQITLSLTRTDGTTFLKRTFTKASFNDCLDDDYRKRGVLMGFVFDKVDNNRALFAASVSHPGADDEYIPIVVTITPQGAVSMARDTEMDTSGNEDEE